MRHSAFFFCFLHNLYNLIQFNTDLWTRENKTARSTKMTGDKRNTDKQTVQRRNPASRQLSANGGRPSARRGGITVDSFIWSVTCAISATDPVQSDQGLKLDSAPSPRPPRKTPGSSSKHKRRSKNLPLVWPSADIIWEIK